MQVDPSKTIPTASSSAEEWIAWHQALKNWFSKKEANFYWTRFWNQRAGSGTDADVHSLRSYMQSQGVDVVTTTGGEITDGVMTVVDFTGDTIKWTRGILIGGVILTLGIVAYYFFMQTRQGKSVGDMAMDVASIRTGGIKPQIGGSTTKLLT